MEKKTNSGTAFGLFGLSLGPKKFCAGFTFTSS